MYELNGALTILLAISLAACAGSRLPDPIEGALSPVGPTWVAAALDGIDFEPAGDRPVTIVLEPNGRFSGWAGCNRYFGTYAFEGDRIRVSEVGSTKMACPAPIMSQEQRYLNTLDSAVRFRVDEEFLDLMDATGKPMIRFVREAQLGRDVSARSPSTVPPPPDLPVVFSCPDAGGDFRFAALAGADAASLWLPERFGGGYYVLGRTRAASGARYEADTLTFWNKGGEALLALAGRSFEGCRMVALRSPWDEARYRGIEFRATGNEPGWALELDEGRAIRFRYGYGEHQAATPVPEPITSGTTTTYRARTEAHDLTLVIERRPCTDSMSGERFDSAVTVTLDGETYRGCGRQVD